MTSVLIFAPYATWTPVWETDLELIQRHVDAGDSVCVVVCNRSIKICDPNPEHSFLRCRRCLGRSKNGLALIEGEFSIEELPLSRTSFAIPNQLDTLDEVKKVKVEEFDLGWAALSSVVSWTRDPEPDLSNQHVSRMLKRSLEEGLRVYSGMRKRLRRTDVDLVYVFNGRTIITRAVVRACQAEGVGFITHDRGRDAGHFELYRNRIPHDRDGTVLDIRRAWATAAPSKREGIAEAFYRNRRGGIDQSWVSYTSAQSPGLLPQGWDSELWNIVIFMSSEDELASIGDEWRHTVYESQLHGIRTIASELLRHPEAHLYVRMHPNLQGNSAPAVVGVERLGSDRVTVIAPESEVSSYAMLDAASRVLTFGSTMGIEAASAGKVSVVAGPAVFAGLGSTIDAETHEDVCRALFDKQIPAPDREGALIYAFYEQTRGQPFKYFKANGFWSGEFKGTRVSVGRFYDFVAGVVRIVRKWRQMKPFRS